MKIYGLLQDLLDGITLDLAWFTSFNMSPQFVEKYLLPLLAGNPENRPVRQYDYEALQENLKNTDIRFFCDYRAIDLTEGKKTSIPFHLVDVEKLAGGRKMFKGGIFHPKIIFLQGYDKDGERKSYVVAGSANLTVSGWGRNRESIIAREVRDRQNAEKLIGFFNSISGEKNLSSLKKAVDHDEWLNELEDEKANWEFVSSLDNRPFMENLIPRTTDSLYLWSPYFSSDLKATIDTHLKTKITGNLYLVPDNSLPGNRMRIADSEKVRELLMRGTVHFMRDTETKLIENTGEQVFSHAKVWITDSRIAIGSWNMTEAAIAGTNLEAGLIATIKTSERKRILDTLERAESVEYSEQNEIDAEKIELRNWECICEVTADWLDFRYRIDRFEGFNPDKAHIFLPGLNGVTINEFGAYRSFIGSAQKQLLKERIFSVKDMNGKTLYVGIIVEENIQERPGWEFDSFTDLVFAWADGAPEEKHEMHRAGSGSEAFQTGEIEDAITLEKSDESGRIPSWYLMFLSMKNIKQRIEQSRGDQEQLRQIAVCIPGCVSQLIAHVRKISESSHYTDVFRWYLVHETNTIVKRLKRYAGKNKGFEAYGFETIPEPVLPLKSPKDREFLEWIKKECGYVG